MYLGSMPNQSEKPDENVNQGCVTQVYIWGFLLIIAAVIGSCEGSHSGSGSDPDYPVRERWDGSGGMHNR